MKDVDVWYKKGIGSIIVMVTDKNGNSVSIADVSIDNDCDPDNEEEHDYLQNLAEEVARELGYIN